ncbi:hypothetical protein [Sulfurovum sp.]|uniref:hypothetical protein n=1 Tax=Sulfurovum sp. TaxID=1969726 RepID=UPI003567D78C
MKKQIQSIDEPHIELADLDPAVILPIIVFFVAVSVYGWYRYKKGTFLSFVIFAVGFSVCSISAAYYGFIRGGLWYCQQEPSNLCGLVGAFVIAPVSFVLGGAIFSLMWHMFRSIGAIR